MSLGCICSQQALRSQRQAQSSLQLPPHFPHEPKLAESALVNKYQYFWFMAQRLIWCGTRESFCLGVVLSRVLPTYNPEKKRAVIIISGSDRVCPPFSFDSFPHYLNQLLPPTHSSSLTILVFETLPSKLYL